MKKRRREYCILLFKIYRGTLIYIFCLSNLKKPTHQLKHFKVDQASLAHNHKFFLTIRIRFIMVPMLSSIMLSSITSFKLVSNLKSKVLIGSFAIVWPWLTDVSNCFIWMLLATTSPECLLDLDLKTLVIV